MQQTVRKVVDQFKIKAVGLSEIYSVDADIFAPCALGAIVNDDTIPQFKFKIIAGSANNQLADEEKHGEVVRQKGILYAPDYVIMRRLDNVANEYEGYPREKALSQAKDIYDIL